MVSGIIYRAYNKISNKSYIGQTIRNLEIRKQEHLKYTVKEDYKFGKALRKYSEDSWEWSILAEVEVKKLDEYEKFFIKDLDTFKNGYNTLQGSWDSENHPKYDSTVYKLYHPEYGEINGTSSELGKKYDYYLSTRMKDLINGKRHHVKGFVLFSNKDRYDEILKLYEFYHPNHGIVKSTIFDLVKKYKEYFTKRDEPSYLTRKKNPNMSCKGWVLAKYKDIYNEIVKKDKSDIITLKHKVHGCITETRNYFTKNYNMSSSSLTQLKTGKVKQCKGWEFIDG